MFINIFLDNSGVFDPSALERKRVFDKRHDPRLSNHIQRADKEMMIALQRKAASSTTEHGWLALSNRTHTHGMSEDVRANVLLCECNYD